MARYQRLAFALLPAVAVGGRAGALEFAVVALVTGPRALGAAAQRLGQAAGAALENVLVDVLGPGPGEGAGVVAADDVKGAGVQLGVVWENHGHESGLLSFWVMRGVPGNSASSVQEDQRGRVGSVDNTRHQRSVT